MFTRTSPKLGLASRLRAAVGGRGGEVDREGVEEALLAADLGPRLAAEVTDEAMTAVQAGTAPIGEAVSAALKARLDRAPRRSFELGPIPAVILLVGVNGSGKTTTAAKLAARLRAEGHSVLLAAADTYRAGAVEQMRLWGDRLGIPVIAQRPGADPAAVAFDGVAAAVARDVDVVIIDTAGRLQSAKDLMAELAKIHRVIARQLPGQPAHVLLVLDATTGQNGLSQAETFLSHAEVTGIVLAKMDGTAKGGIAVAIADRHAIPVQFVGMGEEVGDLAPFDPGAYLDWLMAA